MKCLQSLKCPSGSDSLGGGASLMMDEPEPPVDLWPQYAVLLWDYGLSWSFQIFINAETKSESWVTKVRLVKLLFLIPHLFLMKVCEWNVFRCSDERNMRSLNDCSVLMSLPSSFTSCFVCLCLSLYVNSTCCLFFSQYSAASLCLRRTTEHLCIDLFWPGHSGSVHF